MCTSRFPVCILGLVSLLSVLVCGQASAQFTYYAPQVVDGLVTEEGEEVFQTVFTLVNLSEEVNTVTVSLTTDEGEPLSRFCSARPFGGAVGCGDTRELTIPPFDVGRAGTWADLPASGQDFPKPSLIGWAKIEASHALEPMVTLHLKKVGGEILTATVVPSVPLLDDFAFHANNKRYGSTGFALLNPSPTEDATVTFTLYDEGELHDQRTISLESLGKVALFLDQDGLFTELDGFRGMVRINSSVPLSCGVILLKDRQWIGMPVFKMPLMEQ